MTPNELGVELRRFAAGLVCTVIAVLLFVVLVWALPAHPDVYASAIILIVLGALGVSAGLTYQWNRPALAWVLSWVVVPSYLYIGDLIISGPANKFGAVAYIFGAFHGVVAGLVGVGLGMLLRWNQQRAG